MRVLKRLMLISMNSKLFSEGRWTGSVLTQIGSQFDVYFQNILKILTSCKINHEDSCPSMP